MHERAWLLIEAGDRDAAAALVASMPERPAAYRWRHTAMLTSDAELAAAVADRRRCAALYEQLLPMADEFAVVGAAVFTTGPVALQLGLLAAALGRWDDARGPPRGRGPPVRSAGRPAAGGPGPDGAGPRRGGAGSSPPGHGDHDGGNVFRRDGDVWTVAFDGRTVPLRDAKGLRDLAVLLAAPGREVAATELVAGVAGGRRRRRRARRRPGPRRPGPGRLPGPAGRARRANWPRPTRITTSNGRPGWPPNATR